MNTTQEIQCECGNPDCGWRGPESEVNSEISDFWGRVVPGDEMPMGECPECRMLAHIVKEEPLKTVTGELLKVCKKARHALARIKELNVVNWWHTDISRGIDELDAAIAKAEPKNNPDHVAS